MSTKKLMMFMAMRGLSVCGRLLSIGRLEQVTLAVLFVISTTFSSFAQSLSWFDYGACLAHGYDIEKFLYGDGDKLYNFTDAKAL